MRMLLTGLANQTELEDDSSRPELPSMFPAEDIESWMYDVASWLSPRFAEDIAIYYIEENLGARA